MMLPLRRCAEPASSGCRSGEGCRREAGFRSTRQGALRLLWRLEDHRTKRRLPVLRRKKPSNPLAPSAGLPADDGPKTQVPMALRDLLLKDAQPSNPSPPLAEPPADDGPKTQVPMALRDLLLQGIGCWPHALLASAPLPKVADKPEASEAKSMKWCSPSAPWDLVVFKATSPAPTLLGMPDQSGIKTLRWLAPRPLRRNRRLHRPRRRRLPIFRDPWHLLPRAWKARRSQRLPQPSS